MKVYLHIWADGIKKNMEGHETSCVLIRRESDLEWVSVLREAKLRRADLVFQPNAALRLPGFGGRVMCWLECDITDVRVRMHEGGRMVSLEDFYAKHMYRCDMFHCGEPTVARKGCVRS